MTVGLVALPLAMAFAISSGLPPQAGLYCAIVTGFLISALGGSRFQIGGPTGAFVVVVSGIVASYGVDGLFMCTMMAGVILVVLGVTGMGAAVKFIPRPVVIGFTNGIARAHRQHADQGLLRPAARPRCPASSGRGSMALAEHARTSSPPTTALGGRRAGRADPAVEPLRARACPATSSRCWRARWRSRLLQLPVETIGTRFGGIPRGWPPLVIPQFHVELIPTLLRRR